MSMTKSGHTTIGQERGGPFRGPPSLKLTYSEHFHSPVPS